MEDSPAGPTPLCAQLNAVVESIMSIADILKANGQKVRHPIVIVCTVQPRLNRGSVGIVAEYSAGRHRFPFIFLRAVPHKVCSLLSTAVVCQVTVMIATDGESSDGNVADALRPLTNVSAILRC
jgi:hypothetical protein